MPYITVGEENLGNIDLYYKDWGKGQPIVFSHGWPLSADDWDTQMLFFLKHGYRVIAHDRRGHGRSSQTGGGHDMDHYADDLAPPLMVKTAANPGGAVHVRWRHRIQRAAQFGCARWRSRGGARDWRTGTSRSSVRTADGIRDRRRWPGKGEGTA